MWLLAFCFHGLHVYPHSNIYMFFSFCFRMRGGCEWVFSLTVFLTCVGYLTADNKPRLESSLIHKAKSPISRLKRTPWAPSEIRLSSADINHFLRTRNSVRRGQKHSSTFNPIPTKRNVYQEGNGLQLRLDTKNENLDRYYDSRRTHLPIADPRVQLLRQNMLELIAKPKRSQLRPRKSSAQRRVKVGIGQHAADFALKTFSRLLQAEDNKVPMGPIKDSKNSLVSGQGKMRFIGWRNSSL